METDRKDSSMNAFDFRKREKGFTLLEVIVAISILTFGILAVASMQMSAIRGNAFAGGVTEGATWAGDEIEKLMRFAWDDPLLQDTDGDGFNGLDDIGFDNDPTTLGDSDQPLVAQGKYTIHCNVADNVVINNTKTVHVIVTWTDHGALRRITIRRIIPRIT
jgi:type IV pilus assembly protein PilV